MICESCKEEFLSDDLDNKLCPGCQIDKAEYQCEDR